MNHQNRTIKINKEYSLFFETIFNTLIKEPIITISSFVGMLSYVDSIL